MAYYLSGCRDCGENDFVTDYHAGDVTCRNCGLVAEERILCDEYIYNNNYEDTYDISRCQIETKNFKEYSIIEVIRLYCLNLHLCDDIRINSINTSKNILKNPVFKRTGINTLSACIIYIVCNLQKQYGFARTAKEIYEPLGINGTSFNKLLKDIFLQFPELNYNKKCCGFGVEDIIFRNLQKIPFIEHKMIWDIKKEVIKLDEKRKTFKLMMGSSPNVIISVLIFIACNALDITMDNKIYLECMCISKTTLDKHVRNIMSHL
jgi:transcription initiation factor TFIIIB Brf1 subunit/transcription initiation factor TFIIB